MSFVLYTQYPQSYPQFCLYVDFENVNLAGFR